MYRGVGTGETGEARASPEIRGCLKSNSQIARKKNVGYSFFFGCVTCNYTVPTPLDMNGIFYIIQSCEYVEYFKIRFLMAKLLTDHNQTSVLRNEKWPGKLTKQTQ